LGSTTNFDVTTKALLAPYFCYLVFSQQDFGRSGRCASLGAIVSDLQPKPRLWRGVQRARFASEQTRDDTRRPTMQKGTVKWFNPTKGYGFIRPSTGDKDVFVHISAVERAGLSSLNEGQTVEYELVTGRNGKTSAENLKVG
jgi:CspA family cold shock protein